jgi:hypothetical protein
MAMASARLGTRQLAREADDRRMPAAAATLLGAARVAAETAWDAGRVEENAASAGHVARLGEH